MQGSMALSIRRSSRSVCFDWWQMGSGGLWNEGCRLVVYTFIRDDVPTSQPDKGFVIGVFVNRHLRVRVAV
jgi:hypothetical protein